MVVDAFEREAPAELYDAERARAAGNAGEAERIARDALARRRHPAAHVALALALLDRGEGEQARHCLEGLLEVLLEGGVSREESPDATPASFGVLPDATLAEATAATLELVGSLEAEGLDRAFEAAEVEDELLVRAEDVAERVLDELPAEASEEIVPDDGSPFATRTFAELLERQGHEAEAALVRSRLADRPSGAPAGPATRVEAPDALVLATLESWLENLRRTAA